METNLDKVSYLIGREIAGNLIQQSLDLNTEFLFKGIESRLNDEESTLSEQESGEIMHEFQRTLAEKLAAEKKAFAENLLCGKSMARNCPIPFDKGSALPA